MSINGAGTVAVDASKFIVDKLPRAAV